ncbi:MAG: RluA family pseudouridine synthase [bacterium]|nr:RluA family pseudouridine synthase [bacterium]
MTRSLEVVHVDNHLLVVAKPAGLPSVPDASGDESLLERAKAWIAVEYNKPGAVFLGVVHRLDRPVSGVVAFARTSKAAARLTRSFREHAARKLYWAVSGEPAQPELLEPVEIEQWLVKDAARNRVRAVEPGSDGARQAITKRRAIDQVGGRVLWELRPETGRPHQLRVAMASDRLPLRGDLRYGADAPLPDRSVALHALHLSLPHPTRGATLCFAVPPPKARVWDFPACRTARAGGLQVHEEAD